MLKPHEERVIDEREELDGKLTKLEAFISSTAGQNTLFPDRTLLIKQAKIMTDYILVLDARIERFYDTPTGATHD